MEFTYRFPVVKGLQANSEYYIAMVPLKTISKLFPSDEEYVAPEYRAQRKLNTARIPTMCRYITENRNSYVFTALAASIDGEYRFIPTAENDHLGILEVSMDATLLINDGQHRKAAIIEALKEDTSLQNETISVVFYGDQGLERSQQMFTDLNKHAVKTSNSIAELYDSRDQLAVITRRMIQNNPFLNTYTDKEKDILGKYSSSLFTLSTFYNANKRIVRGYSSTEGIESFLDRYWNAVVRNVLPWQELVRREISKVELREKYIVTQSVIIQVFGRLGHYFYTHETCCIEDYMRKFEGIDWLRNASMWKLRTIREDGRMINSEEAIVLTCNAIKTELGIPLDAMEIKKEQARSNKVNKHG